MGDAGGRESACSRWGPHTAGDLIVHVPDAEVVFAADVLFVGVVPVMWAGPTANWLDALDRILSLDLAVIVPGTRAALRAEIRLLLRSTWPGWTRRGAWLGNGMSVMEAAHDLVLDPDYRDAPWGGWDAPSGS